MRKLISIVTPVWNEEDNISHCHAAVKELFATRLSAYDYEHIFCDNCSLDGTVSKIKELASTDSHVKLICNARNFGPFNSSFNGLMATSGDAVCPLFAVDLQDPVSVIGDMVQKWEEGWEVVYGVRKTRQEGWVLRSVRHLYYRVVNRWSDFPIPPDVGEFQLIDRKVVDALRKFDDYYPYLRGMIASCGFRATGIEYTWVARARGMSKNRLYHLIDQAMNGIVSSTKVPLRLTMFGGFFLAILSILYALGSLIVNLIFYRELAQPGIATLIVALFFFSGVQLFIIGLLGEYVGAIHFQVRKRPLVVERERVGFQP